jgi:hypothetical protein
MKNWTASSIWWCHLLSYVKMILSLSRRVSPYSEHKNTVGIPKLYGKELSNGNISQREYLWYFIIQSQTQNFDLCHEWIVMGLIWIYVFVRVTPRKPTGMFVLDFIFWVSMIWFVRCKIAVLLVLLRQFLRESPYSMCIRSGRSTVFPH